MNEKIDDMIYDLMHKGCGGILCVILVLIFRFNLVLNLIK